MTTITLKPETPFNSDDEAIEVPQELKVQGKPKQKGTRTVKTPKVSAKAPKKSKPQFIENEKSEQDKKDDIYENLNKVIMEIQSQITKIDDQVEKKQQLKEQLVNKRDQLMLLLK